MTAEPRLIRANGNTKYGWRKGLDHAQAEANRVGRKVYLQFGDDGFAHVTCNGPMWVGMTWREFYPATTNKETS